MWIGLARSVHIDRRISTIRGRLAVLKSALVLAAGVAGARNRRAGLSRSRTTLERLFRRWRAGTRSVLSMCLRGEKQHEGG